MANTRIKDISTTTSTTNADDYIAIDGATSGTRKITASTLGGNFDENVVVEFGGNKTTYASNFLRSENGSYYIDAYTTGGDIIFRTSVASALDTQSMIIDGATGRIGIGVSAPDRALHLYSGSVATVLKLDSAGADTGLEFAHSDTVAAGINCSTGGDLEFRTGANSGANERVVIDSTGNVTVSDGQMRVTGGAVSSPSYSFAGDTDLSLIHI